MTAVRLPSDCRPSAVTDSRPTPIGVGCHSSVVGGLRSSRQSAVAARRPTPSGERDYVTGRTRSPNRPPRRHSAPWSYEATTAAES